MEIHSEEDAMKVKVYCLLIIQVAQYMIMVLKVAIDGFHSIFHGTWRAKGHVMWILTNQQAVW